MSTDTNGEIEDLGGAGEEKMLLHFIPPVSGHVLLRGAPCPIHSLKAKAYYYAARVKPR